MTSSSLTRCVCFRKFTPPLFANQAYLGHFKIPYMYIIHGNFGIFCAFCAKYYKITLGVDLGGSPVG